ncbi:NAD(P)/FAD-dependent oxidoreductase [Helicobacter ailurogastricus]|uniref:NAD(P)/FAD-dependent oxidoreductase n=1 Tax=Helicobacter ailurogastricus TaxID=1578720 RepID=UPI00244D95D8|nr:NAD(P)/FAD-dependent oxidoreductase [Helicobacter ailurogastricus]GMB89845.1 NAD(P)/FAD-dependent oxidoreductase [Helicobacter ailurogastricus]
MQEVLILGAGYASLAFVKSLSKEVLQAYSFTLVSQSYQHGVQILLHDVVAGLPGCHAISLTEILPPQVRFIQDEVLEIKEGVVVGKKQEYTYTKLIVGLGFASESFGVAGVAQHAHPLVDYKQCQALHQKLQNAVQESKKPLNLVVCGAGFSGIELVGALADAFKGKINIICVEAMPKILPMFSPKLAQKAQEYLQKLGVRLQVGAKILECLKEGVVVEIGGQQEQIPADFIFWTCGVRGSPVIENSPFFKSVRSRVEVNSFLEPVGLEERGVFVLGDCALFKDAQNRPYPPTAQLANQMGAYLGAQFQHVLKNKPAQTPFTFKPKGVVCSLGVRYAVGQIGALHVVGLPALWLKNAIEWWHRRVLKL